MQDGLKGICEKMKALIKSKHQPKLFEIITSEMIELMSFWFVFTRREEIS